MQMGIMLLKNMR